MCIRDSHYLIRHTDTNVIEDLWDDEFNCIKYSAIAKHSLHAIDLSASLLGVYSGKHTNIKLTELGDKKYNYYCSPNEEIITPILDEDFTLNNDRCYWTALIRKLEGQPVDYIKGEDPLKAICYIIQTPMKWNYWHFSIRWLTDEGFIHDKPAVLKRNWVKRLGHNSLVLISQIASLSEPLGKSIDEGCFRQDIIRNPGSESY